MKLFLRLMIALCFCGVFVGGAVYTAYNEIQNSKETKLIPFVENGKVEFQNRPNGMEFQLYNLEGVKVGDPFVVVPIGITVVAMDGETGKVTIYHNDYIPFKYFFAAAKSLAEK